MLPKTEEDNEGLAAVLLGEKWRFIDKSGELVIDPQYDSAYYFNEGLATVKIGDKFGFIDRSGNMVIQPQYDGVDDMFSMVWLRFTPVGDIQKAKLVI